jgi:hypothetical protein
MRAEQMQALHSFSCRGERPSHETAQVIDRARDPLA